MTTYYKTTTAEVHVFLFPDMTDQCFGYCVGRIRSCGQSLRRLLF